ncbi:unnamed protein product [Sphenostylis stenocarpa]|uniref:MI domain-containing protein n=1 Tax=Sphenostylis stenocarpa TaxID=92480 RepID=A0AA86TEF5_9FABA|nr:unnamed protein product [Sphenostylis stenocarpa]
MIAYTLVQIPNPIQFRFGIFGISQPPTTPNFASSSVLARDQSQAQARDNNPTQIFSVTLSLGSYRVVVVVVRLLFSFAYCTGFEALVTRRALFIFVLVDGVMASTAGFLTDEHIEIMEKASQNVKSFSSSPISPSSLLAGHNNNQVRAPSVDGKAQSTEHAASIERRWHSGKFIPYDEYGAARQGTWEDLLDKYGDPNYDNGEEPYQLVGSTVTDPLDELNEAAVSILEKYFRIGDVEFVIYNFEDLQSKMDLAAYYPYLVKRLVSMAMVRHNKEREMASVLLLEMEIYLLSSEQIEDGIFMLIESADDLALDVPDAVDMLALFLTRAVIDELIPRAFLAKAEKALPESSKGIQAIQTAVKLYLSAPHHADLVEMRWGCNFYLTVEDVKKRMVDFLRVYVQNGCVFGACGCIFQLEEISYFHHEFVRRALVLAMEIRSAETPLLDLIQVAVTEGFTTSSQVVKGFSRLEEVIDDLAFDIPSAQTIFQTMVHKAILNGSLDASFKPSSEDRYFVVEDEKVSKYKKEIAAIIHQYFLSGDIPELIRSLEDLGTPEYNPIFLKRLITVAMDRKKREKEMASVLLSALHMEIFSTEDIANGFVLLLESAEDTALDKTDASIELAIFLARAVIDDVLAPLKLEEMKSRYNPYSSGGETAWMAQQLVSAPHAGERILRCWAGRTGWAVEDAKDKIMKVLEEYESGGVVSEACECIRELGMAFMNHEVVKKALVMGMEKKNDRMLDLLQECFSEGLITINQMTKGFTRMKYSLDHLALDIPNATEKFSLYLDHALNKGWLLPSFDSNVTNV